MVVVLRIQVAHGDADELGLESADGLLQRPSVIRREEDIKRPDFVVAVQVTRASRPRLKG